MKKALIWFIILAGIFAIGYFGWKAISKTQHYRIPSGSMEPTLRPGDIITVNTKKKPLRNDIIVFRKLIREFDGVSQPGDVVMNAFRLVAFGGDTLELRDGYVFINGKLTDDSANLKLPYVMSPTDAWKVMDTLKIDVESNRYFNIPLSDSSFLIHLSYDQYKIAKGIGPVILDKHHINLYVPDLYADKDSVWSLLNYGPIVVPRDHYFVLGDNREGARDSRIDGPVPVADWRGTMTGKK